MVWLILALLVLILAPWLALMLAGGAVIAGVWSRLSNG